MALGVDEPLTRSLPRSERKTMSSSSPGAPPSYIFIISHSPIFYWGPVWLVGFLLAALTYLDGHQMAIVPVGTAAERGRRVEGDHGPRDFPGAPPGKPLPVDPASGRLLQPRMRMATSNNL